MGHCSVSIAITARSYTLNRVYRLACKKSKPVAESKPPVTLNRHLHRIYIGFYMEYTEYAITYEKQRYAIKKTSA